MKLTGVAESRDESSVETRYIASSTKVLALPKIILYMKSATPINFLKMQKTKGKRINIHHFPFPPELRSIAATSIGL
ncbi:hypothetical protein B4U84_02050 [Westiellopsis prolifica IICB1]|nr:hypothetical protein B4U84_02050 [Westiellopsis prolifica IICB1]